MNQKDKLSVQETLVKKNDPQFVVNINDTQDMAPGDIRVIPKKGSIPEHAYVCYGGIKLARINKGHPYTDVLQAAKDLLREKDMEEE